MILARECKYKGSLGEFTYNTEDFEIINKYTPFGVIPTLHYRGTETDGTKIKIPNGLRDGSYLFENTSIQTPPLLPPSLTLANYMFLDCVSLVRGAILPHGCVSASFMYAGCRSLTSVPRTPNTLKRAQYMCDGCRLLEEPVLLNDGIENITGMFRNCASMQHLADVPDSVKEYAHLYRGCKLLRDLLGDAYEETAVKEFPEKELEPEQEVEVESE